MSGLTKKTLRSAVIRRLKADASSSSSSTRDLASEAVCSQVWDSVIAPLLGANHRRIAVLSYLPMPYELSAMSLMKRVWAYNASSTQSANSNKDGAVPSSSSSSVIQCFVPHMLATQQQQVAKTADVSGTSVAAQHHQGDMLFVQVRNEDDLHASFLPKGKLNILELIPDEEINVLQHAIETMRATLRTGVKKKEKEGDVVTHTHGMECGSAAATTTTTTTSQRGFLCFASTVQCAAAGGAADDHRLSVGGDPLLTYCRSPSACCDGGDDSSDITHWTNIVVLAPAAAFDRFGNRLGKGGGYYDKFLHRCRDCTSSTAISSRVDTSTTSCPLDVVAEKNPLIVIGIGFDAQLLTWETLSSNDLLLNDECWSDKQKQQSEFQIPVDAWDEPVDEVYTPSHHILCRRH